MNRLPIPLSLRFAAPAIALLALAGLGQTAHAQTIINAGFEIPALGSGFQYTPSGAGVGWTFTGSSGISSNNSGFTSGNSNAPEGTQVAFLQNANSGFSQAISGFTAGTYTVNFFAAQRGAGGVPQPSTQNFRILIDGVVIGTFQPTTTTYTQFSSAAFMVASGSHTLAFNGLNSAGAADVTAFVDNVRVISTSAPEPGSLALLVAGFVPLVGVQRRKRR